MCVKVVNAYKNIEWRKKNLKNLNSLQRQFTVVTKISKDEIRSSKYQRLEVTNEQLHRNEIYVSIVKNFIV